jgi:hypothetical protein
MVRAKLQIKFPCGYEYEIEVDSIFAYIGELNDRSLPICPIHKEKCKRC